MVGVVDNTTDPVPVFVVTPVPPEVTAIGVVAVKVVNAPVFGVAEPIAAGAENTLFTKDVKPDPDTVPLQTIFEGVIVVAWKVPL